MTLRTTAIWAAILAAVAVIQAASAQQGVVNALATDDQMVDAHGEPILFPGRQTSYGAPCGPGCYGGAPCGPMGAGMAGGPASLNAFGAGANMNVEQCGPHYFDFSAEYISYELDDNPLGDDVIFSTFGFAQNPTEVENQAAIRSGDIDAGDSNGYRLIGRIDMGALSVFEISYAGLYDTGGDDVVALGGSANPNPGTATLFTIFTNYGNDFGGVIPGPEFQETDDALEHRFSFESELHTVEASYRRYWVGYSPRISGTLLVGFRYTSLEESFGIYSRSDDGTVDIDIMGSNHLTGAQVGLDTWITVLQGLRIGVEEKVGIYNNSFDGGTSTVFGGGSSNADSFVNQSGDTVAFLAELKLQGVANLTPSLSIKGGYELLYISDVVRAGDNLLANPPYGGAQTAINSSGEAVYHGWSIGGEYIY